MRTIDSIREMLIVSALFAALGCGHRQPPPGGTAAHRATLDNSSVERRCDPDRNPDCPPVDPPPDDTDPPRPPPAGNCVTKAGDYAWSCRGTVDGYRCISVNEPSDSDSWFDNYFCTKDDTDFVWSFAGEILGRPCVAITEPSEPSSHAWTDNFLCTQKSPKYRFYWSVAGPLADKDCLRWFEPSDPHTWDDNYLCFDQRFFDGDTHNVPIGQ